MGTWYTIQCLICHVIDLQVNNDVILFSTCTSVSPIVLTHARKDICGSDKSGQFVKIWESKTGDEAEATCT